MKSLVKVLTHIAALQQKVCLGTIVHLVHLHWCTINCRKHENVLYCLLFSLLKYIDVCMYILWEVHTCHCFCILSIFKLFCGEIWVQYATNRNGSAK